MTAFNHLLFLSCITFSYMLNLNGVQNSYELTDKQQVALQNSLSHWDKVVEQLSEKSSLCDRGENRLTAYLYHAQKKFVDAYFGKMGRYPDNVDSVSLDVIQLFYPTYKEAIANDSNVSSLAIEDEINKRFREEQAMISPISIQNKELDWVGKTPNHGLEIPNWKPWVLTSVSEFRLPSPPPPSNSSFWQNQLSEVKEKMAKANNGEKQQILFWANMTGVGSGDFVYILNQYMKEAKVPLITQIKVRDAIGIAIADATIAAFDSKYTYLVRRPNMLDPNLKTYIDTPNHPSFPSAHSTVCFAVLQILEHYLPENQSEWQRLAEEGGMSRIWAGIHFPTDHEGGKKLGKNVGQAVLKRLNTL